MGVYKDQKRKTWYVKTRYKDWQGNVLWRTKRGFTTKRDAQNWENDFLANKHDDLSMNFSSFAERYVEEIAPRMKISSLLTKKAALTHWILPYFGDKKICDITPAQIFRWQNTLLNHRDEKTGEAFSQNYIRNLNAQLKAVFRYAERHYNLKVNPMKNLDKIGSMNEGKMDFWTFEEYKAFAQECMEDPLAFYCFETLYWTGMREGELLALTPEDVDFQNRTVSITKTYHCINGKDVFTTPKTKKSIRVVKLPKHLCDELQDYLKQNNKIMPKDRMFPVQKEFLYGRMKKFADRAEVKRIRIHDLRHSHVSLLFHLKCSALEIGERIGHSSSEITYHYAHLFPEVMETVASKLDDMAGGVSYVKEVL